MMTRFCAYIDKVFDFEDWVAELHDHRFKPRIPTAGIWRSVFFMFVTHQESLNALEAELRVPKRFDGLVGFRKPSIMGTLLTRLNNSDIRIIISESETPKEVLCPGRRDSMLQELCTT